MIEGDPSAAYEQANADWANLVAATFQTARDRDLAEGLWQAGKRSDAMAILMKNPNVGIEYRSIYKNEVTRSGSHFGKDAADFLHGINIAVDRGWLSPVSAGRLGHALAIVHEPQRLTDSEVDSLEGDLKATLFVKDCEAFTIRLLEQLKADTGRSQHGTTDIMKLFDAVKKGRGFDYRIMNNEAAGGGGPGYASISINRSRQWFSKGPLGRGGTLVHELLHVAGYDHYTIAIAMYNLGEKWTGKNWKPWLGDFPDPKNDPLFSGQHRDKRLDGSYSGFILNRIDHHCK
jgi:hypothetical protein